MRISVAASHVEPIDMRLHGGWGSVAAPPLASDAAQDDGETLCCAVSGAAADGSGDVIALVDSAEPSPSVEARRALCFSKPRSLSHVAAAQLPILVLTAAAALHSVLIAGSTGRLPKLLVELLSARGARPCVAAAEGGADALQRAGASAVFNYHAESFTEQLAGTGLSAVVDVVGREEEPGWVREALGCAYVSAASPALLSLSEDGALAAARGWQRRWGRRPHEGRRVWRADDRAAEALSEAMALLESGKLTPPAEASAASETGMQYLEFLRWPRDSETGRRFGFPGERIY
ncbi:hypothetical protein EMIHUDRAFT_110986 [Emiliania huxleyi CCMP1516]|uniref:Alcohol dehydrogenase-like C-terminal domain-containing protein n=2 Tax=Emiliania huxleyi TaxID=2903 RepID=A0A0D3KGR4_EMIH1|nr:hypothetical protein EMIHUDRAFT_110986 [Emiliania huxleyi CCMP1516]EOD34949.1 hypothetical protein EMIHUDRAFT_110986 [Emiliania huxleyi CCMP1516]|eukprot:XP_005787378.1 hypothetical protein EMIHUDRAFT_110986 [Emiliania huxleyi CCMP1516]